MAGIVIALNTIANLQNNSKLNFVVTCFLCFFVGMVLVQGSAVLRIFHGIIIIVVFMSAEMIFYFLLNVSVNLPTNERVSSSFAPFNEVPC